MARIPKPKRRCCENSAGRRKGGKGRATKLCRQMEVKRRGRQNKTRMIVGQGFGSARRLEIRHASAFSLDLGDIIYYFAINPSPMGRKPSEFSGGVVCRILGFFLSVIGRDSLPEPGGACGNRAPAGTPREEALSPAHRQYCGRGRNQPAAAAKNGCNRPGYGGRPGSRTGPFFLEDICSTMVFSATNKRGRQSY